MTDFAESAEIKLLYDILLVQYQILFKFEELSNSRVLPLVSLLFQPDSCTRIQDWDLLLAACIWVILRNEL